MAGSGSNIYCIIQELLIDWFHKGNDNMHVKPILNLVKKKLVKNAMVARELNKTMLRNYQWPKIEHLMKQWDKTGKEA